MYTQNDHCDGCGRRCPLSDPGCPRGTAMARGEGAPERHMDGEEPRRGRHGPAPMPWHEGEGEFRRMPRQPGMDGEPRELPERRWHGEGRGRRPDRMETYERLEPDEKLVWAMRELSRQLHELSEGRSSQGQVLALLSEAPSMQQNALTERLGVQPGTASEVLGKLENAGLIVRTVSEEDRRTSEIRLTEAGRKVAQAAGEGRQQRRAEMFSALSGEEKDTLLRLLEKLSKDWRERYGRDRHPRPPRGPRGPHMQLL